MLTDVRTLCHSDANNNYYTIIYVTVIVLHDVR